MNDASSRRGPKIWTRARLLLAAATFALLAVAFSSGCNHPPDTANVNAPGNTTTTGSGSASSAPPSRTTAPKPGMGSALDETTRNVAMKTLEGKPLRLADYAGKVVVLDLWATWCPPCRQEIPELVQIQKDYQARGVEVVGLTIEGFSGDEREQNVEAVRAFTGQFNINYTVGWADETLARTLLLPSGSIPQTYILDRNGRVAAHFKGYGPSMGAEIRQAIDQALAGSPKS